MIVLTRSVGDELWIGKVYIRIERVTGEHVRLKIDAPGDAGLEGDVEESEG